MFGNWRQFEEKDYWWIDMKLWWGWIHDLQLAKTGLVLTVFLTHIYLNDYIEYYQPHFLNWIWHVRHFLKYSRIVNFQLIEMKRLLTLVFTCIKFQSCSLISSYQTRVHKVPSIKRGRRTDRRTSSTLYHLVFTGDNKKTDLL